MVKGTNAPDNVLMLLPSSPPFLLFYNPLSGAPPPQYQGSPQQGQAYAYPVQPQQVLISVPAVAAQGDFSPGLLDLRSAQQRAHDAAHPKSLKEDIDTNAWMCIVCCTGGLSIPVVAYVFCCGGGKTGCERPFTPCLGAKGCYCEE